MSIIRILREEISNRIAAGEVIERPASVVKELVDNAIDAGAKRIFINIEKAGSRLIQVTDNGSGMDKDDAMLCFEAHATSKIQDIEDLESIATFGFRGEAIPSIASVSRFEINTRQHDSIEGCKVICEGGTIKAVESFGCPPGTGISVRNLFYNVAARKKFLKSAATEEAHIHETALLLALSRLDIYMELKFDGRLVFSVPEADNLRTRASLLFGRELVKDMLSVNYAEAGIMVTGLVARPGITRNTRKEQRFFVNGRPAAAAPVYHGVKEAYEGLLVKGRHAPCLLYFVLDPARVDINVHPAKREVRFKEGQLLSRMTATAVSQALRGLSGSSTQVAPPSFMDKVKPMPDKTSSPESGVPSPSPESGVLSPSPESGVPSSSPESGVPSSSPESGVLSPSARVMPVPDLSRVTKPVLAPPQSPVVQAEQGENLPGTKQVTNAATTPFAESSGPSARPYTGAAENFKALRVIGQYRSKYILAENDSGLVLLSIRAAKERVLFEKLQAQFHNKEAESQFLLLPVPLELSPSDTRLVNKYIDKIRGIGFDIEPFGGKSFVISAIPASLPNENIKRFFFDIVDQLQHNQSELKKHTTNFLLKKVCKSAVKGKYKALAEEEIKELISELSQTKMPYSCPDGRPILIHFSENELLKRFGRKD